MESLVVVSPPQAEHGGLPHPTILAAAALLGVEEVWAVGGAQAVALLAYGGTDTDGQELRAGRHGHRPGQRLRHRGQAAAARAGRDRRRGRAHGDRRARRRHGGPGARRRGPGLAGRARPVGRLGAGHHQRRAGRRRRRRAGAPGRGHQAHRADPHRAHRPAVGHGPRRRRRRPGSRSSTPTPPSTWRSRPRGAREVALQVRNAGAIFIGPWAPVSLGDYCAGSNHVLPTGGCARHSAGLSVQTFLRGVHLIEYTEDALARGGRPGGHAGHRGRPARRTGRP